MGSGREEEAWSAFLERYAARIQDWLALFLGSRALSDDCFPFVLEELHRGKCRKLATFDPDGIASFSSWLGVVTRRLAVDWRRRNDGRPRDFEVVGGLSLLEQEIFRFVCDLGMRTEDAFAVLLPRFPTLTFDGLETALSRLRQALSSRQHWLLTVRRTRVLSVAEVDPADLWVRDEAPNPEQAALRNEQNSRLEWALAQLPPRDQVLLRLRYQQDLTLREMAPLVGASTAQAVDRELRRVLGRLRTLFGGAA